MPHKPIKPLMTLLEDELALEEKALRAEQEWFLTTQVEPGLQAIKRALQACQEAVRLQEDAKGSLTLAISSPNNDILKGFVTLAGSFIVKGELMIKLPKLAAVKVAIHSQVPSNASAPSSSTGILTTTTGASTSLSASSSESIVATEVPTNTEMASSEDEITRAAAAPPAVSLATAEGSNISKNDEDAQQQVNNQGAHQVLHQALDSLPQTTTTTTTAAGTSGAATPTTTAITAASQLPIMNTHQLLHSYRPPGHLTQAYLLEQIKDAQNHTAQAIFHLEDYWSNESSKLNSTRNRQEQPAGESSGSLGDLNISPTGDIQEAGRRLKTLLELMQRHLRAGVEAMTRPRKEKLYPFRICDPKIFSPTLSEDFVIEFYIKDSQLVCAAYALQLTSGTSSGSGGNALTTYLHHALPGGSSAAGPTTSSSTSVSASTGTSSDSHHHLAVHPAPQHGVSGDQANKSGQGTPRSQSPGRRPASKPPSTYQLEYHHSSSNLVSGPPPNETVVLPSSSKIGLTTKGGINKYRGKVATTLEDKAVQVQSSKLEEISTRLAHAEGLCRQMLNFLVLQESVATS